MEIDNDTRREVARQLNQYASDEMVDGSLLGTLKAVTGATSWRGCLTELAMLIKPRECHVIRRETYCGSYECEEAGTLWTLSCGHKAINDGDFPPNFCHDCGAEVISGD